MAYLTDLPGSSAAPSDTIEGQLPGIKELWAAVLSHLFLVGTIILLGTLVGLYASSAPRRYTSEATLRIQPSNGSALELSSSQGLGGSNPTDEKINSELAIMQGRTILLKVAEDLKLPDNPSFWGTKTAPHLNMSDPSARDMVMGEMHGILLFTREPKTDIVHIACTTTSPLLSAQIANSITNAYIARIFQVRYGSTERVSTWLVGQLNDLRDQVEHDQEQLVDLQSQLGVLGLDEKNNAYLLADSLEGITKASSDATIQRIVAEAKLRVLSDSDPNLIENEQQPLQGGTQSVGLLQNLRASQAEAAAAYANLTAKFGSSYPDVKQAKARLEELNKAVKVEQDRILNQAKSSYSAAASNEKMTADELKALKTKAFTSHDNMVRYVVLQRQYEADRVLYESLMQRLRVAGINAGLESAQVDIVDLADISSIARRPLPYQRFEICFVASIFLGIILAIVVDFLDTRVRRPEDAERQLHIPLLSVLQRFSSEVKKASFDEVQSGAYSEGQQLLRSSILMSTPDRPPNSILVTSALPSEGKSTVSRGLAAMLAMHNSRVLLIDADLHRPAQSIALKLQPLRGLSDILTSSIDPAEVILPIAEVPGLFLLPSGRCPPQPATLLSSDKMRQTITQLKAEYDFIVIDSPPVLRVSDTVLCGPLVEAVVLIVRENLADIHAVRQTINLLRRGGGNVIGFAMNATTGRGSGYDSYYRQYGYYGTNETTGGKA
jgi:capsular exopolysaccharide synthesis family protein